MSNTPIALINPNIEAIINVTERIYLLSRDIPEILSNNRWNGIYCIGNINTCFWRKANIWRSID